MHTEDFCIYSACEPFHRRCLRIIYMAALVFSVSGVLAYFDFYSLTTGVVVGCVLLYFLWEYFGSYYQIAIRANDIYATLGEGRFPIKWSEVDAIEPKLNSIGFVLKDGSTRLLNTAPFGPGVQGALLQMIEPLFRVYQADGPLVLPRPGSVKVATRRMVLLPLGRKDQEDFVQLKLDPSEAVQQLYDSFPEPLSKAIFDEEVQGIDLKMFEWRLGLFLEEDLTLIGYITVSGESTIIQRSAQIGLGLQKEYRGQGYGAEAVEGVLDYLEEKTNLQRALAGCFVNNPACAKALENAGMRKVGKYERFWFRNGEWQDSFEFEKVLRREESEVPANSDETDEEGESIRLG